jgi:hypothetical protein
MSIVAGWVHPPKYKKGLDPLGVQQPCIAVYSTLRPGITNVTDRIAYFGFGPWFIWSYAQRHRNTTVSKFIEMLRRAEVLLALIGIRHALTTNDGFPDQHDGALVGVDTLRSVVTNARANAVIRLSEYATLDDVDERYFKNRRGGLGQYYLGPLRDEYQLLGEREGRVIDFTIERGKPMAEAVAAGVNSEKFFQCLDADRASIQDLDSLSPFCPCQLRTKSRRSERALLLDTVLGLQPSLSLNAETRRRSIELIIDFLRAAGGCESQSVPEDEFLVACYARVLPNGQRWTPAASNASTADLWAFYVRGELLSLAMQRLFREALLAIDKGGPPLTTVEAAGRWCTSVDPFMQVIRKKTFDDLLGDIHTDLPALSDVGQKHHEMELWELVSSKSSAPSAAIDYSIRLILTLVARHEKGSCTIEEAIGPNRIRLENYPINADTVFARARTRWRGMMMSVWLADILSWILATHRQVALRKLSQSGDDTRRLRMGDSSLYVDGDPIEVARTVPRLKQALRFLHDLGLTSPGAPGHLPIPTREALSFLQQSHAN